MVNIMAGFKSALSIERACRKGFWRTIKALMYVDVHGIAYEVPAGTESDGASIPRRLWVVFGHPMDIYFESAILHDWLYAEGSVSRGRADELFLEAMKTQGISWWRRKAMYRAVRMFGGSHYGKVVKEDFVPPEWRT